MYIIPRILTSRLAVQKTRNKQNDEIQIHF